MKLEHVHNFETVLRTIYGMDIMFDNVDLCCERLLYGVEKYRSKWNTILFVVICLHSILIVCKIRSYFSNDDMSFYKV